MSTPVKPVKYGKTCAEHLAQILLSLDRCRHGIHHFQDCPHCPQGVSAGNPHLRPGAKAGYTRRGELLYVPHGKDLATPTAWRQPPPDTTTSDDPQVSAVYRERARLVAGYTHRWPSVITEADDYPGMWIVFIVSPCGQLSWHLTETDLDLFAHVRRVDAWEWDGHSTAEKYDRLDQACRMWEGKA